MKKGKTYIWLWQKTKGLRGIIALSILLGVLLSLTSVLFISTSKEIIDAAVNQDRPMLNHSLLVMVGIIASQLTFRVVSPAIDEILRSRIETNLRQRLARVLFKKSYQQVNELHTGEWLTHFFSDVETITEGLINIIAVFFKRGAELIFALILLFRLAPEFFYLVLVGGAVMFVVSTLLRKRVKLLFKDVQAKKAKVQAFLQEQVEQFVIIKVFQAEQLSLTKLKARQLDYRKSRRHRRKFMVAANSSFVFGYQIAYFIAIYWGATGILNGTITYGALTAMIQLVSQVMSPIAAMSGSASRFFSMIASAERLLDLEKDLAAPKKSIPMTATTKLIDITFDQVTFIRDGRAIFENSTFVLKHGQRVGLLGKSGIGKTTLFQVLLGMHPLDSGEVTVRLADGDKIQSYALSQYDFASLLTYVPQGTTLFSGSVRENLLLANPGATEAQIWEVLDMACAREFVEDLEDGLDTILLEKAKNLSEGQRQRLTIARALLADKPIILYDEMTSALDEQVEEQFLINLSQMTNRLSIIISHKQSTRSVCQRTLELKHQKIKEVTHV